MTMPGNTGARREKRVLLVTSGTRGADFVRGALPVREFPDIRTAASAGEARRAMDAGGAPDILIVNLPLSDMSGVQFACEEAGRGTGVILLCRAEDYERTADAAEDAGVLTLPKPMAHGALYMAVRLLAAVAARLSRMEEKNRSLQEKMEDIRVVNRAKWLLIERHGMSEQDAHYFIEKQAMDARISRRAAAERILRAYDL